MRAAGASLLLLLVAGCAGKPCDANTCVGCCDLSGACVEVPYRTACGLGGVACVACSTSQLCVDGTCQPPGAGGGGGSLEPWQQELLTAHNRVRSNATPEPSPALPALAWSAQAQAFAQSWVEQCQWQHNPGTGNRWGENLFASTGEATPGEVVSDWAAESIHYTWTTNSCAAGQFCGHYTQLVWRATTSVGCARKLCTLNSPFGGGDWWFWVCDYAPPGNVVGQKPY